MPLYRLLQERVFEPETITALREAYERALGSLGLKERTDPATLRVAQEAIAIVEGGVRDSTAIYAALMHRFRSQA
jgi:hypothetical protein